MQNAPKPGDVSLFRRIWKVARWVCRVLVVLYVGAVVYSIPHVLEKRKTEEVVARIHAQKLIIENVNGEHLPPPPTKTASATTWKSRSSRNIPTFRSCEL